MKKTWKRMLIGTVIVFFFLGLQFSYDFVIKPKFLDQEVVYLINEKAAYSTITEQDVTIKRMPIESVPENYIKNVEDVIGIKTAIKIDKNTPLTESLIDRIGIHPKEGQETIKIPADWFLGLPGTIRPGDRVKFYPVPVKEDSIIDRKKVIEQVNQETDDATLKETLKEEEITDIMTPEEYIQQEDIQPIVSDVIVAYPLDGSNNVVLDKENDKNSRYSSTGKISDLEVNIKPDDFLKLAKYRLVGYKFILGRY